MNKLNLTLLAIVLLLIIGIAAVRTGPTEPLESTPPAEAPGDEAPGGGEKNISYTIDGEDITLVNGKAEIEAAPGSASKLIIRYFGNEVRTDLDLDGREDVAFLITEDRGGSGTFFYVVAALNKDGGYVGSHALLLGDRIAPQTTGVSQNPAHKAVIVVNYADRKPGEPMTAQPSVGKSIWLKLNPETMQWAEVAQDFEGEADPARMSLGMKEWVWVRGELPGTGTITPKEEGRFTITFGGDGNFSAKTDCNAMSGSFVAKDGTITFGPIMSTLMFCDGSQEGEFSALVSNATTYRFTSRGELILAGEGGMSATFR